MGKTNNNSAEARKELGYQQAVDLEEGLKRTYKWYLQENLL